MASYSWNAAGGGDWNIAADWRPHGTPAAADTTDFATGGNAYTVTGDGSTAGLTVDGDDVTFTGFITAGTVDGMAGSLIQAAGLFVDTGGGTADVAIVSGLNAQWISGAALMVNQLYVNQGAAYAGDLVLNDGGSVTLDTSAVFGGGTLTLAGVARCTWPTSPGRRPVPMA